MRYTVILILSLFLMLFLVEPVVGSSPTPTATSTPQMGWLTEPTSNIAAAIISAVMALLAAAIGWWFQSRQLKQKLTVEQSQFQNTMELEWQKFSQALRQQKQEFAEQQTQLAEEMEMEWRQFSQTHHLHEQRLAQEQSQFQETMDLEWRKFREQFLPPRRQLLERLENLEKPRVEDWVSDSPYIVGPPIRETHRFYGRKNTVDHFFEIVLGKQMTSVSLLGARRSGKTSFLYHISHPRILESCLGHSYQCVVPVYLTTHAAVTSPAKFYAYLVRETLQVLESKQVAHLGALDFPTEVDYGFAEEFYDRACQAGWCFVLLLDEFERLTASDPFDEDFFLSLRALAGDPTRRNVAWAVTSFRDLYQLGRQVGMGDTSPFFNVFHPIPFYIGAFSEKEARQLVTEPAAETGSRFKDEDSAFIIDLAGRLPFALQAASSLLYQAHRDGKKGESAQCWTRERFEAGMEKHFRHYWMQFTIPEREALHHLTQSMPLKQMADNSLIGLAYYGFVEKLGSQYCILGSAFADWVHEASVEWNQEDVEN